MWHSAILLGIICFASLNAEIKKKYRGWAPLIGDHLEFDVDYRNQKHGRREVRSERNYVLIVPVPSGKFLTTAEMKYRHILYPEDQIAMVNPEKFGLYEISFQLPKNKKFVNRQITVHPQYGFLSHANNIALVDGILLPRVEYSKVKKEKTALDYVNKTLNAYYPGSKSKDVDKRSVKVVDFKKCQEAFHVDNPHYLDENEQICTENFRPVEGYLDLHNGMLFDESGLVKLFVGITSLSNDKYTLSTFVPYHCDHPLLDEICS